MNNNKSIPKRIFQKFGYILPIFIKIDTLGNKLDCWALEYTLEVI